MSSRPLDTQRGPSLNARLTRSAIILITLGALAYYTAKFRSGDVLQTGGSSTPRVERAQARSLPSVQVARRPMVEHAIDDAADRLAGEHFSYIGVWEHVRNVHDGRSDGTSSRSYRAGSMATIRFRGVRFALYGVTGTTGGRGEILIDGVPAGTASFYSTAKATNVPVFTARSLSNETHTMTIVVLAQEHGDAGRRFVNIDGAAIGR